MEIIDVTLSDQHRRPVIPVKDHPIQPEQIDRAAAEINALLACGIDIAYRTKSSLQYLLGLIERYRRRF